MISINDELSQCEESAELWKMDTDRVMWLCRNVCLLHLSVHVIIQRSEPNI